MKTFLRVIWKNMKLFLSLYLFFRPTDEAVASAARPPIWSRVAAYATLAIMVSAVLYIKITWGQK
ncbi:hypothetical protein [Paenibacillus sp. MMS18-CY102]|uniref:hypothetical protein n=1 Tax=Paenibacillus sp. MMS18-CY102 TaxID=2682849 RepID=UPI0013657C2A|nr:hypothetical protein [Paenibacillus sp. MMS18-CY102]MWC31283.1 hypothetical protein [Paenibacillus sp. MMS18-CY102]